MSDTMRARIERAVGMHLRPSMEATPLPGEIAIVDAVMAVVVAEIKRLDRDLNDWRNAAHAEAEGGKARTAAFEDLLDSIYLHVSWPQATRPLTTEQKDLWADSIDAHSRRLNEAEPGINLRPVDRWWAR